MRYATILLLAMALAACQSTEELQRLPAFTTSRQLDLRKYTERGFLFTPHEYVGDYKSIGVITVSTYPAAWQVIEQDTIPRLSSFGAERTREDYNWKSDTVSVDQALEEVYRQAVGMGADALINFQTERVPVPHRTGIRISGFAIDRSGAGVTPN